MSITNLTQVFCTLITANHILDYYNLVTGYGHISVRNPNTNTTFFFNPTDPPALLSNASGYHEYQVSDGRPANGNQTTQLSPYSEIWIHQAVYSRYPEVNSVVHSHSRAVLPYAHNDNLTPPLQPMFNLEAVLGARVPVFDIADYYFPNDTQNFLVNNARLGMNLANVFSGPDNNVSKTNTRPDYPIVLQRAHGLSATGVTIEQAVWNAWSAQDAAEVETASLLVSHAAVPAVCGTGDSTTVQPRVDGLFTARELADSGALGQTGFVKDWPWFEQKVRRDPFYRNDIC